MAVVSRWASPDRLVVAACCGQARRAKIWSLPNGRLEAPLNFGDPSSWELVGDRVLTETRSSATREAPEEVRLRSWPLDGRPAAELGRFGWRALGASRSLFSPDGESWLYVKGRQLFARELPVVPGTVDRLVGEHPEPIVASAWLPGETTVFTRHDAKAWRAWTLGGKTPPQMEIIPMPTTASGPVPLTPSGTFVDCGPFNARAQVWKRGSWLDARPLVLRRRGLWNLTSCRTDPSGGWLAASTAEASRLTLWPLSTAHPTVLDGYSTRLRPIAFSPDGRWLASFWSGGSLRLWPLAGAGATTPRLLNAARPRDASDGSGFSNLAIDPASRLVLAVGTNEVWVAPLDGSRARRLEGFERQHQLHAAALSPSGRLAASAHYIGSGEKVLRVWDVETGASRTFPLPLPPPVGGAGARPSVYASGIVSIALAGEAGLYTGGHGGVRRWDLATGAQELLIEVPRERGLNVEIRPDKNLALTREYPATDATTDCALTRQHDLAARRSRPLSAFGTCTQDFALDPSGTVVVTGDQDGIVRVGRLSGGEPHLLIGHEAGIDRVAISPDLRWVASTGEDSTLRLWPMPDLDKPPLHTLPHDELVAKLKSLTNLRAVRDPKAANGWTIGLDPFPGWKDVPTW